MKVVGFVSRRSSVGITKALVIHIVRITRIIDSSLIHVLLGIFLVCLGLLVPPLSDLSRGLGRDVQLVDASVRTFNAVGRVFFGLITGVFKGTYLSVVALASFVNEGLVGGRKRRTYS